MNKKPTVSVIIPVCCNEKIFRHSLNSVLNQTFQDFEIIVVNYNDEDNLREYISFLENKKIYYFHKKNINLNSARNYGLRRAKGKYITFLDAGAVWKLEKLEKQVDVLDKKPEVSLVYCGTFLVNKNGNFYKNLQLVNHKGYVFRKLAKSNFLHNASVAMFRRSCLEKTGYFDESLKKMADWEFYLRLSVNHKFWGIKKHLTQYRIPASDSESFETFENSGFKVLNKAFQSTDLKMKDLNFVNHAYALRYREMGRKNFELGRFGRSKAFFYEALKRDFTVSFRSDALIFYLLSYFSEKSSDFARLSRVISNKSINEDSSNAKTFNKYMSG